jgi:hypothetical protein
MPRISIAATTTFSRYRSSGAFIGCPSPCSTVLGKVGRAPNVGQGSFQAPQPALRREAPDVDVRSRRRRARTSSVSICPWRRKISANVATMSAAGMGKEADSPPPVRTQAIAKKFISATFQPLRPGGAARKSAACVILKPSRIPLERVGGALMKAHVLIVRASGTAPSCRRGDHAHARRRVYPKENGSYEGAW